MFLDDCSHLPGLYTFLKKRKENNSLLGRYIKMDIPAQHSRWLVIQLREVSGEAANLARGKFLNNQVKRCCLHAKPMPPASCCSSPLLCPLSQEQQLICIESFAYKPLRFLSLMYRLSLKSFPKQLALELRVESD
jgi:hypothetical protein